MAGKESFKASGFWRMGEWERKWKWTEACRWAWTAEELDRGDQYRAYKEDEHK